MFLSSFRKALSNNLRASFSTTSEAPVLYSYENKVCKALLNRPKALNAQNTEMIQVLQKEANKWKANNDTRVAIFAGAGGKAFSAGGDVKYLYQIRNEDHRKEIYDQIFRDEYTLDYDLAHMKTIQVVFWDGLVMGGGVGISVHAPIRIATENTVLAMPEGKIGLFTDCGAGYFYSRLRNNLGYFYGVTGHRLRGQEVVKAGLADCYVKSENLAGLEREIIEKTDSKTTVEDLKKIVEKYHEPVVGKELPYEDFVKDIFGHKTVYEIYEALKDTRENKEFANQTLAAMDAHSPFSMKIIHEHIKRGENLDLKGTLQNEMRLATRFMAGPEFFEGTRCTLVDRNDKPNWMYPTLKDVPRDEVVKYFEQLPPHLELQLP